MKFIHLHNHSDYSILDGAIPIDKLISKAKELKMPGVAMTDHGNMFGAIDFYQKASKEGIKPIIGQEFYVTTGSRFDKAQGRQGNEKSKHLILLAKNQIGYKNLLKLSSIGYLEGFYYKPRIDLEVLEKHRDGLVCSTACIQGEVPQLIINGQLKEAANAAGRLQELFGKEHFYLEMQDHGIPEQKIVNVELIKISNKLNIPLIATNDCHYLNMNDASYHDVLICVQTGKTLEDKNRLKLSSNQFYFKTPQEMHSLFSDFPDALSNTYQIYEMINLKLTLGDAILPNFDVPDGFTLDLYLEHLVYIGAKERFNNSIPGDVLSRIKFELSVITGMNFSGYFLIVWDFIKYAKKNNIPVGPGRGSAAGSMVSYCLKITDLNPLKYNLLFERFLNPDRNEMPDMDIDFCAVRREEVIDYVKQKYGEDHVSQIITFNKLKAKAVIKDVARVMNIPFSEANSLSKFITEDSLQRALEKSEKLKSFYSESPMGKKLIEISMALEGLIRSAGKHAAGIIISKGPLSEYVPLYKDTKDGSITSQYEKKSLEAAGLVKMDFLGLKNLTIINRCLNFIDRNNDNRIDIDIIPLDDEKTFTLLQRAETDGVFQLESPGMQNILRKMGPTNFEDIIAVVALYRPGPLGSGMVDDYIERKKNPKKIKYLHPVLEPILKDTLGVIIYQEQVMLISQAMGGFVLSEADQLRKAMSKKIPEKIKQMKDKFMEGASVKNINKKVAEKIFSLIEKFGEYGFNKSHSAAYAMVSYQTAYLKAHYSIEFMTALLSVQEDKQEDIKRYINVCRNNGIQILPPDILYSDLSFTIEGNAIRFGMSAIKGVGEKAIKAILHARKKKGGFNSLEDFFKKIDINTVNKGVIESFIKAGALDSLDKNRASLFLSIDRIIEITKRFQEDKESGQGNLFSFNNSGDDAVGVKFDLMKCYNWTDSDKLRYEKEVLSVYLSGHPLEKYEKEIKNSSSISVSDITNTNCKDEKIVNGVINQLKIKSSKNGKKFAVGKIEDIDGSIDVLFFPNTYLEFKNLIIEDEPVLIKGRIEFEEDIPQKIIATEVRTLKEIRIKSIAAIHIKLHSVKIDDIFLNNLKDIIDKYNGNCPVFFDIKEKENIEQTVKAHHTYNIFPSDAFISELAQVVGSRSIYYSYRNF